VVVLDRDGVSDFDALAFRRHDKRAQFYAFDMLARDGEDLRGLPLSLRMTSLARLLSREIVDGIFIAEYERGDIGHDLFRTACDMGLEGIVSKRLDRAYGTGKCKHWLKVKNRAHPGYSRVKDVWRWRAHHSYFSANSTDSGNASVTSGRYGSHCPAAAQPHL
jgi:bifunctional non-homologous end joining protein LigD